MEPEKKDHRKKITEDVRKKVIMYFNTQNDNSAKTIANFYNLNFRTVNVILDKYFKDLRKTL